MRRRLAQAVRTEFDRLIKLELNQFSKMRDPWADTGAIYRWNHRNGRAFLHLQMHSIWEWFTVECGLSAGDRFPIAALPVNPRDTHRGEDIRFRASKLWTNPPRDVWWELAPAPDPAIASAADYIQARSVEELLPRVRPASEDAVQQLRTYALPFFEEVLSP